MKQLLTYFALSYLISWLIWLPLYGHIFGLTNLPSFPFHHALGGLGPLLASVITTWIFLKGEGIKNLLANCLQTKPHIYLTVALLSPFILAIFALLINYAIDRTPLDLSGLLKTKEFPQFHFITFLPTI